MGENLVWADTLLIGFGFIYPTSLECKSGPSALSLLLEQGRERDAARVLTPRVFGYAASSEQLGHNI